MIKLNSSIKKVSLTAVFLLLSALCFNIYAQHTTPINFKYKVDSLKVGEQYQYTVSVTITTGDGPFIYELLDKPLVKGGKSVEKSAILQTNSYTFKNLKNQEYYIYVYTSNEESGRGKRVIIH